MALALDHFRNIPQDVYLGDPRFSDSVPALVGCLTTAAIFSDQLDDDSVLDLIGRASRRLDDVVRITSWLSQHRPRTGQDALRDALSALEMALRLLQEAWRELPSGERQRLLETAVRSLSRFCYLSRPAGSGPLELSVA